MKRHPPIMPLVTMDLAPSQVVCQSCGADPLDPIHWPPVGWRERLLASLGLLR